jgi:hypothetical protein
MTSGDGSFEHEVQPLLGIVDGLTPGRSGVGSFLALWRRPAAQREGSMPPG